MNIHGSENLINTVVRFDDDRLGKILSCWTVEKSIMCVVIDNDGNTFIKEIQTLTLLFKSIIPNSINQ